MRFLSYADYVVVLGSNGTIAEQGTFEELIAAEGYVHTCCIENVREGAMEITLQEVAEVPKATYTPEMGNKNAKDDFIDDKTRQVGDFSIYRYYFSCLSWKVTATFLILQICWAFFSCFPSRLYPKLPGLTANVSKRCG